jgi:hypothetical protein
LWLFLKVTVGIWRKWVFVKNWRALSPEGARAWLV